MKYSSEIKTINRKNGDFHCYLLHSLDPKHPYKTYVGFTVNETYIGPHKEILKKFFDEGTKDSSKKIKTTLI